MPETTTLYFDPSETVRGIQQLLISDKKKIAFFFGAGTSLAGKYSDLPYVPAIAELTEKVESEIMKDALYKSALAEIKAELTDTPNGFNIETLLSNLEDKIRIIGAGTLNALSKEDMEEMKKQIESCIQKEVSIHTDFDESIIRQMPQYNYAKWLKAADRKQAVEIFTTNYDYLFEIGMEALDVPYYDGFTGSYEPFFNPASLEEMDYLSRQTKLWKIHGSLGLHKEVSSFGEKIIRKYSDSEVLLIYPSTLKYSNSKKMPYAAYLDRIYNFLRQDDAVLFVCGYSFGDEHINERMLSALSGNSTSHIFALFYDVVHNGNEKIYALAEDSKLAQLATGNRRISVLGMRNAVLGSKYGTWRLNRKPDKNDKQNVSLYFYDKTVHSDLEINHESQDDETWTGDGEFCLPDFCKFVRLLLEMIPNSELEDSYNG